MNQELFVEERAREWDVYHYLLKKITGQNITSFSAEELEQFITLYREITGDLMYARTNRFDTKVVSYLNTLVAKGHPYIYAPPPGTSGGLRHFLLLDFPQLVRLHSKQLFLAIFIFFAAFFIAYLSILAVPRNANLFTSEKLVAIVNERLKHDTLSGWAASPTEEVEKHSFSSSRIMTNNIEVGFYSLVSGIFLGAGTAYVMYNNGLLLGAVAAIYANNHLALRFWSLVLPHGVIEFTAIFICAQAGFLIGQAIINPGKYTRLGALSAAGNTAMRLVLGTVPMFIVAAIIEGFFTPNALSDLVKLSFSALTGLLLLFYFCNVRGGREV